MFNQTVPCEHWGEKVLGYLLATVGLPMEAEKEIGVVQKALSDQFSDVILLQPVANLHITLMDWLAPLVDYGTDKDRLFEKVHSEYDMAMEEVLEGVRPIIVRFNKIVVTDSAIILVGVDGGQYAKIRSGFLSRVNLLPNTKLPPNIIHATIARFEDAIDLGLISDRVDSLKVDFEVRVDRFQLLRHLKSPLLEYEVLKEYELRG